MRQVIKLLLGLLALEILVVLYSNGKKVCKRPVLPENLNIAKIRHRRRGPGNVLNPGSKIFFKCRKGFLLFGRNKIKCMSNGLWTHNLPSCIDAKIRCPAPESIVNGTVTAKNRVLSNAVYNCDDENFEIVGLAERRCLPSGKWEGEPPVCRKRRCKKPRRLSMFKNGKYKIENKDFEIWSTITFDCDKKYYIPREDAMTCMKNGKWMPQRVPKCYPINCGDPGRPRNGRRYGSKFTVGGKVIYDCNYGYTLIGSKERTCRSDFTWSGEPAICDNKKYDCPDPGIPQQGRRIGDKFNLGDQVKFYCFSGYSLVGSAMRKCKKKGTWTGFPAVCEDDTKVIVPPLNKTAEEFQDNFVGKLSPITCSSNKDGKCNYPKSRGRAINLNHPKGLDLIFLFDSSTSISEKNFKEALNFACYLIQELGIDYGIGGTRIAAITFSTRATIAYNLEDERVNTVEKACRVTKSIEYSGGGTGTRYALRLALTEVKPLFQEGSGRAIILIADGKSNFGGSPELTANVLKDRHNVEIFVIGVGKKQNKKEMRLIASKGPGHIFSLAGYASFRNMTDKMIQRDYSVCGEGGVISRGRILGGKISNSENGTQWPWQVRIYKFDERFDYKHRCGGALIRNNVVVTAAHCLLNNAKNRVHTDIKKYRVVAGKLRLSETLADPEESFKLKKIYYHQDYRPGDQSFNDDIAIFELERPVEWSSKIRPVCLPEPSHNIEEKIYGYVSGWGNMANRTKANAAIQLSEELRYVYLPVQSNKTCGLTDERKNKMFCAGEGRGLKDSCSGDSGGPFVVNLPDNERETKHSFKLMGVVSHGFSCGTYGEYGFYTRLTNYVPWIKRTMAEMKNDE